MFGIGVPVLLLREEFRRSLSLPQGTLFVAEKPGELVGGVSADVAVGDVVSSTVEARVKVVDLATRRGATTVLLEQPEHTVVNPRGSVSLMSITIAAVAKQGVLLVLGEEDMVVTAFAWSGWARSIAYGQPGVGVVLTRPALGRLIKVAKVLKPTTAW